MKAYLLPVAFLSCALMGLAAQQGRADSPTREQEMLDSDRSVLAEAEIEATGKNLLLYFRKRTLTPEKTRLVSELVVKLGSEDFDVRENASEKLLEIGPVASRLIRDKLGSKDPEVVRRIREALREFDEGPGIDVTTAAARVLAHENPKGTIDVLLDFLPHAEERLVRESVLDTLVKLTPDSKRIAPRLRAALQDSNPVRRGAAAFVLGRLSDEVLVVDTRKLFQDPVALVRFRAVQGRLHSKDPEAVPVLIDLVTAKLDEYRYDVEAILFLLAGESSPDLPVGDDTDALKKRQLTWSNWWKKEQSKVDLARYSTTPTLLGRTLIPEMHANRVWEVGRDGKKLWELSVPGCPIDAQVIDENRILVAELNGNRVTERTRSGKILWEHKVQTPIACQRLRNGMTWISTNHRFFLVTHDNKEKALYTPENGFFMHSVQRQPNGNVVVVSMAGEVREISASGKVINKIPLKIQGGWSGIEAIDRSRGRYLVSNNNKGLVQELDRKGTVLWEYNWNGACYASRLPDGRTLVVSNRWGIRIVDRRKKTLWEKKIDTSLWRGHRR